MSVPLTLFLLNALKTYNVSVPHSDLETGSVGRRSPTRRVVGRGGSVYICVSGLWNHNRKRGRRKIWCRGGEEVDNITLFVYLNHVIGRNDVTFLSSHIWYLATQLGT